MKIDNKWLLIIILGVALFMRAYSLRLYAFIGNDPFLHASVIRQYLETGNLDTYELTRGTTVMNQPKGLYWVTILPALMGVPYVTAFQWTPIISGLIAVIMTYYLMKLVFNNRTALMCASLLALSMAHTYRTMANFYRGEGFFLTFLLGVMITYVLAIKEDKRVKQVLYSIISSALMALMITVWNGHLLGVIVIISWLILSQALAFHKGDKKSLAKLFTYSIIAMPVYLLSHHLFIHYRVITNLFLHMTGTTELHALITLLPALLGAGFYFGASLNKNHRTYVLVGLLGSSLLMMGLNNSLIMSVLETSVLFKSALNTIGVSELLPPTPELHWVMHGLTYYLLFPGLVIYALIIIKSPTPGRIAILAYSVPVLFLMLNYSRYSFLGSLVAVVMTSLLLESCYKWLRKITQFKKGSLAVVIGLIVVQGVLSIQSLNYFTPRINEAWIPALEWMGDNLEPGVVLSWWDHGSWIQYYTKFPTVLDSVYGMHEHTIERMARFLVTDVNDSFSDYNADYLVVGNDLLLYIQAIIGLSGETGFELIFALQKTQASVNNRFIEVYLTSTGQIELYDDATLYREEGGALLLSKRIYANSSGVSEVITNSTYGESNACLIINPAVTIVVNDKACNSNLIRFLFRDGREGYSLLYANDFVRVFDIP